MKSIDIRLPYPIFRKNYCCICGGKLNKKWVLLAYNTKTFKMNNRVLQITRCYICKNCNYEINFFEQKKIRKAQKKNNMLILSNGKELIKKYKINEYYDKENDTWEKF